MKFQKNNLLETVSLGKGVWSDWPYELMEESRWIGDTRTCVFKYQEKFYKFSQSRDGSEYTDWNYYWHDSSSDNEGEIDCLEVFPTIEYKKTYSTNPKKLAVIDFGDNLECFTAWDNQYDKEISEALGFYGGNIIYAR